MGMLPISAIIRIMVINKKKTCHIRDGVLLDPKILDAN